MLFRSILQSISFENAGEYDAIRAKLFPDQGGPTLRRYRRMHGALSIGLLVWRGLGTIGAHAPIADFARSGLFGFREFVAKTQE